MLYIPASVAQFGSEEYDLGEDQVFSPGITLIVEPGSAAQAYAEASLIGSTGRKGLK